MLKIITFSKVWKTPCFFCWSWHFSVKNNIYTASIFYNSSTNISTEKNANNFCVVDYEICIKTKVELWMDNAIRCLTVQEMSALIQFFEPEGTLWPTTLALWVQNPQLAGFLLFVNLCNLHYIEGSTAWLYDYLHFLWPLHETYVCFDHLPYIT